MTMTTCLLAWGEHCVTAQLKDVTNNDIVDSVTTCTNVEQQFDLVIDIIEGFSDSTLDNVMENFGSNLEYRMENYEADFPYDDGDCSFFGMLTTTWLLDSS